MLEDIQHSAHISPLYTLYTIPHTLTSQNSPSNMFYTSLSSHSPLTPHTHSTHLAHTQNSSYLTHSTPPHLTHMPQPHTSHTPHPHTSHTCHSPTPHTRHTPTPHTHSTPHTCRMTFPREVSFACTISYTPVWSAKYCASLLRGYAGVEIRGWEEKIEKLILHPQNALAQRQCCKHM